VQTVIIVSGPIARLAARVRHALTFPADVPAPANGVKHTSSNNLQSVFGDQFCLVRRSDRHMRRREHPAGGEKAATDWHYSNSHCSLDLTPTTITLTLLAVSLVHQQNTNVCQSDENAPSLIGILYKLYEFKLNLIIRN